VRHIKDAYLKLSWDLNRDQLKLVQFLPEKIRCIYILILEFVCDYEVLGTEKL